jgi:AcrR family transcriptional regulator
MREPQYDEAFRFRRSRSERQGAPMQRERVSSEKTKRRRPRQARSQNTVAAVLTATAQVLKREGYSGLTTRAIAERAGVSVGSLYQYFPTKEAVVRALAEQHRARVVDALERALARSAHCALPERTRILVDALLAAKTVDPHLNAQLTAAMLEIDGPRFLAKDTAPFRQIVESTLRAMRAPVADLELTSFVIVGAVEGILAGAATGELRGDPRLAEAITSLVLGLLVPPAASRAGR